MGRFIRNARTISVDQAEEGIGKLLLSCVTDLRFVALDMLFQILWGQFKWNWPSENDKKKCSLFSRVKKKEKKRWWGHEMVKEMNIRHLAKGWYKYIAWFFWWNRLVRQETFNIGLLFYLIIHLTRTVCLVFSKDLKEHSPILWNEKVGQDLPYCLGFIEILVY